MAASNRDGLKKANRDFPPCMSSSKVLEPQIIFIARTTSTTLATNASK